MRTTRIVLLIMLSGLLASLSAAGEQAGLKDQKARDSYSLGYQFGSNISGKDVAIDQEILIEAIRDALSGRQPALSQEEISGTMKDLRRRVAAMQEERVREQSAKSLAEAAAFLDANKQKAGITTLPSGLQYRIINEGSGASPKPKDGVRVRFRGTLPNGAEFGNDLDLAEDAVPVIPLADVNKGWSEALQLMKPGSKWQLFIPPQLGYGDRKVGRIPPNSVLIYELELVSVIDRDASVSALKARSRQNASAGETQASAIENMQQ